MNETPAIAPRVLVVEDDACYALLVKTMLQKEGYAVEHCADGEAALRTLVKERFDAVVLDLMIPRVDGMQVLKQMRTMPEHLVTPVIIVTAARLKLVEDEAARYGVKLYLEKTQQDKLLTGLRDIVRDKSSGQSTRLRMVPFEPIKPRPVPQRPIVKPAPEPTVSREEPKGLGRFFRRKGGAD